MGKTHPKGLYSLFFTEMWERFSYYGMRAILILYMTRQILYGDSEAYGIYAAYAALVYATPFIGGVIADQILGYRKSIFLGGVLMAIGLFMMTVESEFYLFGGLAFLIMGNGFFKPNISSMVGKLYKEGDARRDGGFTIFYMGINLGAFFSPLTCGLIGELYGWHYGFGLAGLGMVMGLLVFWRGQKNFEPDNGNSPHPELLKKPVFAGLSREWLIYIGSFAVIPLLGILLWNYHLMNYIFTPFVIAVFVGLIVMSLRMTKVERERIWVIIVLAFFTITFWAFFEQAGSSITLFTDLNVNREIFGFTIPTSVYQSVNPLFIIMLAPIFSSLWLTLARRNREPNTIIKFALGLFNLGIGFGAFVLGASMAGPDGKVAMLFLFLGYFLHTAGELCISPVGLSMVTRLAPARLVAMVMGAWFLSIAMAQHLGGTIAKLTSTERFMESGLKYEAPSGFEGVDALQLRAFYVHEGDTLYSEPLSVALEASPAVAKAAYVQEEVYYVHRALAPGATAAINLRLGNLDPTGDLTTLEMKAQSQWGSYTLDGDTLVYQAGLLPDSLAGTLVRDTLMYRVFETDKPENSTDVALVLALGQSGLHQPLLRTSSMQVKVPQATAIKKSVNTINVMGQFYTPNGDELQLQMVQEPSAGFAEFGKMLHAFVGPTKTIHIYSRVFYYLFLTAMAAGVLILVVSPILKKWMHGEH